MPAEVIRIEHLSKKYRLGTIGTGSLRYDLQRWWSSIRGKDDPFAMIGNEAPVDKDDFWALRDINFCINQGDSVGIIGRNGAGKSTLLKILSQVTSPTTGMVKIKGRIASLLEVGTGFHPDLTGRENIFLNGAILGMTKTEIRSKLDEIIAFSGVEQHIDTPVKRYSSGMYVRLAFAVAAHLEPEILVVDEVLAVGDTEFQKKCIGKMNEVASMGRTVLFVSHNMAAIKNFCTRGVLLHQGQVAFSGTAAETIKVYEKQNFGKSNASSEWKHLESAPGNKVARMLAVKVVNQQNEVNNQIMDHEDFYIEITFQNLQDDSLLTPNIQLFNQEGTFVFSSGTWASTTLANDPLSQSKIKKGTYSSRLRIPKFLLNEGKYSVNALLNENANNFIAFAEGAVTFSIHDSGDMKKEYMEPFEGVIRPKMEWQTTRV